MTDLMSSALSENIESAFFAFKCLLLLIAFSFLEALDVVARIESIEILTIGLIGEQSEVLAEPLIMHDLSGSQEADRVNDVRIVTEAEDIVIGRSRLLLSKGFNALRFWYTPVF